MNIYYKNHKRYLNIDKTNCIKNKNYILKRKNTPAPTECDPFGDRLMINTPSPNLTSSRRNWYIEGDDDNELDVGDMDSYGGYHPHCPTIKIKKRGKEQILTARP